MTGVPGKPYLGAGQIGRDEVAQADLRVDRLRVR